MRTFNKKGDETTWIILLAVLAIVAVIILAFWLNRTIRDSSNSTTGMTQCAAQGKGAGCFAENAVDQKESDGFKCTKGILGCKSGDAAPYCCYRLFS